MPEMITVPEVGEYFTDGSQLYRAVDVTGVEDAGYADPDQALIWLEDSAAPTDPAQPIRLPDLMAHIEDHSWRRIAPESDG